MLLWLFSGHKLALLWFRFLVWLWVVLHLQRYIKHHAPEKIRIPTKTSTEHGNWSIAGGGIKPIRWLTAYDYNFYGKPCTKFTQTFLHVTIFDRLITNYQLTYTVIKWNILFSLVDVLPHDPITKGVSILWLLKQRYCFNFVHKYFAVNQLEKKLYCWTNWFEFVVFSIPPTWK